MTEKKISKALIEQIKDGKVILFLGAGAAFDSKHPKGLAPLTGKQLADKIADKFLGDQYLNYDLQHVSELAINETDLYTVQKFIADIFIDFNPGDHHLRIPLYKWNSIYTTNYDLLIEKSYDKVKNSVQTLSIFIKNGERIQDKSTSSSSVFYNKLHGCITEINDTNLPLILTPDQYVDHRKNRSRLFERLKAEAYEYPILFVGFSFADYDIRQTLRELADLGHARPRSYMIGPNITEKDSSLWETKKVTSLKMTFKEFIEILETEISENDRILSNVVSEKVQHPIMTKFLSGEDKVLPDRLLDFLTRDVDYIHQNIAEKDTDPKMFYKGYFEGWDPIIKNFDVQREITEIILSEVFLIDEEDRLKKQELFLVNGNAGSGKTVFLHRLAWEAAINYDKLCLFYKSDSSIEYNRLAEIFNLVKERIYLFIDGSIDKIDDLEYILNKAKKDNILLTIICSERTNVWNIAGEKLQVFLDRTYTLGYLNDIEIDGLITLLTKYKSLGYLADKSIVEQKNALSEKSGRELLVALYEATAGKPFPDIVIDEYNSIPSEDAQKLYLAISMFHRIGTYARAGNISRLYNISFNYFRDKLFRPLESVVYYSRNYSINDYVFTTRHQHIAELVFEQVLFNQEERFQMYISVISKLDVDFDSDRQLFMEITNARKLTSTFKDAEMIRKIYEVAYDNIGREPSLLQQESIFEMLSQGGNLEKADSLLKEANNIDPDNIVIAHSKAEFLLKKAERSNQKLVKKKNLDSSKEICRELIQNKKNKNNVHAYHTLLKIYLLEIKMSLEDDNSSLVERKVNEFEKTINQALQIFPNESFFLEAESNFNDLINNTPKALESLEKAFSINKRSPYLATRLSNYYFNNDRLDDALKVIEDAIQLNLNDKDLNYKYASLLMLKNPESYIDLKHYLRKSFTKNDKRYEAQFWYARILYLLNDNDNREFFEYLKTVPLDVRIKRQIRGIVTENGKQTIYEGKIIKLEASYGFIKQNFSGETIYFYREKTDYKDLRLNTQIKFNKAFNYNGAIAILI
ncbi:SIR2 family protein [Chryseobacterium oranimense]|uniref:SIR2 family protein n=1 Tax=Chryseobacterium oranimense TaxID=421058 RepID=UPI0021AFBCD7|nr:SIR2 family protein [Chryseobacterium oranimense]UWX59764.1 SIR2 family protein [Chryseobacterium oranimense]